MQHTGKIEAEEGKNQVIIPHGAILTAAILYSVVGVHTHTHTHADTHSHAYTHTPTLSATSFPPPSSPPVSSFPSPGRPPPPPPTTPPLLLLVPLKQTPMFFSGYRFVLLSCFIISNLRLVLFGFLFFFLDSVVCCRPVPPRPAIDGTTGARLIH